MGASEPFVRCTLLGLAWLASTAGAAEPPRYTLIELAAPPGMHAPVPLGMNNRGLIVGEATDDGQGPYMAAVAWLNHRPIRLTGIAMSGALALAVSDDGTVVGSTDDSFVVTAFTWNDGQITLLPGAHGIAHAINANGMIVGSVHDGASHAARWVHSELEHLLPDDTISEALDVNIHEEIVGVLSAGHWRAFHWSNGLWCELPNLPGGETARAEAINDGGIIVGRAAVSASTYPTAAVLWENGNIQQLDSADAISSSAHGINNTGWIVGRATSPGHTRAVLWLDGVMHELSALVDLPAGWLLTEALAIDDAGRIVGRGHSGGQTRAFLLVPQVPGDLTGDGHVDVSDLLALLASWGPCPIGDSTPAPCPGDFNGDTAVDVSDLLILLANWQ